MLTVLFTLLLWAIVLGAVYWGIHRIWEAFGLPPVILVVIDVLLVLLAIYVILVAFGLTNRLVL